MRPPGIQPERLRLLLRQLIDIYSPSGKEREIQEHLHGLLAGHHAPVIRQQLDDDRFNLLITPPRAAGIK